LKNFIRTEKQHKTREHQLRRDYDLTTEEFYEMIRDQDYKCLICNEFFEPTLINHGKTPCVDHDHKTGKVRGILCHKCNLGLGYFDDNMKSLKNAIIYLAVAE
jgi:hypothetical protein